LANRNTAEAASVALTDALTQAGQALVTAGQAVLAAASALGGQPACFRPVASLSRTPALLTVTELVNEYLRGKARAGRSDRYLRQLRRA